MGHDHPQGSDLEIPTKRLFILESYLDYEKILVAGKTMAAIARTVESLGLNPEMVFASE